MEFKFYLNTLEIEEPIGWDNFELSMKRDDVYHGMQFEVSTSAMRFFGAAATYLQEQKEANGLSSNVTFIAEVVCDGEQDTDYQTVVAGRLNFGKYKDICGNTCYVEIPFEEEGCKVTFRNRFDQKVDIEKIVGLDNVTALPEYAQLGQLIEMPAKALLAAVDANVATDGYVIDIFPTGTVGSTIYVRPDYDIVRYNNINTGQLSGYNNCSGANGCAAFISPQLLFEEADVACFDGNFTYTSRKKGRFEISDDLVVTTVRHKILKWDGVGNLYDDGELIFEDDIYVNMGGQSGPFSLEFDNTLSGVVTIPDGIGFYAVIEFIFPLFGSGDKQIHVEYDTETLFTIEAVKICPSSEVQYYMVHEALSRVVESITNKCIRVKSEYYGRIDSQPFAFDADGCGSLRMFTGGLKLRKAPDAKFFVSAKELIGGLNAIDNIGFSIEPDETLPDRYVLVIEPVTHFYQDTEILSLDSVALVSNEIQEGLHYAKINVGYKKWEVENINGLNEFNSTREYRTNIETINTTLDILSNLVAGSYPIEITRQQSFAESGAADTTYDNETFIICLIRNAYDFAVEQDAVVNDVNIFDPATIMNFRISPIRNLMRWFKSIINTYPDTNNTQNKLYFNAGTGNYTAAGLLDDATACRLENAAIAENVDLNFLHFAIPANAIPVVKNETASFEYPFSIAQYNAIKANPYGYVLYTCGNSATPIKAFIKELKFRPARGMANFILRKKWEQ
jgi:hypothetical protein